MVGVADKSFSDSSISPEDDADVLFILDKLSNEVDLLKQIHDCDPSVIIMCDNILDTKKDVAAVDKHVLRDYIRTGRKKNGSGQNNVPIPESVAGKTD